MRKLSLILLLFLFIKISYSQNKSISIGVIGGGDLYNYSFWGFPDSINIDGYKQAFPNGEHKYTQKLNYNFGTKIEFQVNKIILGCNLLYSTKDYIIDYDFTPQYFNGQVIEAINKSVLKFDYFDLNINVGYNIGKNKLSVVPQLGFTSGYLISAKSKMFTTQNKTVFDYSNTDVYVQHKPEKFVMSANASIDIRYQITNNLNVLINFYFAQYFKQITPIPMNMYPMAYGSKLGLLLTLNKQQNE